MKKNILVLNSYYDKNPFLIDFIRVLEAGAYNFFLFSSPAGLIDSFCEYKWGYKKIYLGPKIESKLDLCKFNLLYFPLFFVHFFVLLINKYKYKFETIICLNWNEKLIYSPLAKLFGIKMVWLERPDINYRTYPSQLLKFYKFFSKDVKIITTIDKSKIQLKSLGFNDENIFVIHPAIKVKKEAKHQDSIFEELAKKERPKFKQKYFTLGVVTDYEYPNQIESLLHVIKICQTMIPNIQLIIVGDGESKKQVAWTAKKMEIDNLTWFVGWQSNLKKWLDSFDIYITSAEIVKLMDIKLLLKVMSYELPVVSFKDIGYNNFIYENETGLMSELGDSEMLAQNILKLYNNKLLITKFGRQGRELVLEKFDIEKQAKKFEEIL